MTSSLTSKNLLACLVVLVMAGCRSDALSLADRRILWDADGCAFRVEPSIGDTSFVQRVKDADRQECKLP